MKKKEGGARRKRSRRRKKKIGEEGKMLKSSPTVTWEK